MVALAASYLNSAHATSHALARRTFAQSSPCLLAITVLVLLFFTIVIGWLVVTLVDQGLRAGGDSDFGAYWKGAVSVAGGHSPYEWLIDSRASASVSEYTYPPHLAVLLAPVTRVLDSSTARWVWLAVSVLCLVLSWALAWKTSGLYRQWRDPLAWGPVFALLPWVGLTLVVGQLSPQLSLLIVAAFAAVAAGRSATTGGLLAIAACLKIFPALLGGYLLLRRQWRAGFFAVATGLVALAGTLVVLGWETHWTYLSGIIPTQRSYVANSFNISFTGLFTRLLMPSSFTTPVASTDTLGQSLIVVTTLTLLVGTAYGIWRARRDKEGDVLAYALAVVTILLVTPVSGLYNLVIAFLPLAVATARVDPTDARGRAYLAGVMVLLFVPLCFLVPYPFSGWNNVLASMPLFGLLTLWALLLRLCLSSVGLTPRAACS
jgi:hypothetical protein